MIPKYLSLSVIVFWAITSAHSLVAATRPNVLLVLTDDQGFGDFSVNGNPHLQTPHIDELAAAGVRFDRFYVSTFCAPTRAALLTGRYPQRCGVWGVTHGKESLRPSEITIAEALRSAGYRTACFGKWHNGEHIPHTPLSQGFDKFFGILNGHTNNYFDATLVRGHTPESTRGFIADVLTDEAIQFVTSSEQPFFCFLSFPTPHSPFQVADRFYDKFRKQGFSEEESAFFGMCENVDENVGRILQVLKQEGLERDTIVLFLTDNGGTTGVPIFNAGMREGKTSVHEGGSRVPLFIRWPARFPAGKTIGEITAHIDLYPTLLELCGVSIPDEQPALDGKSVVPLMDDRNAEWPERVLFTHNPISERNRYPGAVRSQRYRLVKKIEGPAGGSAAVENDKSASAWQLYDMEADAGETRDLADQLPDLVAEMSQQYEQWLDLVRGVPMERYPIELGHAGENPITLHAHEAYVSGGVRFSSGNGYAHDFLTEWVTPAARVAFDVDVLHPCEYEATLLYGCPESDAGAEIRLTSTAVELALMARVVAADAPDLPLPHRDANGRRSLRIRNWGRLPMGSLHLPAGRQRIALQATSLAGSQAMEFKGIELSRIDNTDPDGN